MDWPTGRLNFRIVTWKYTLSMQQLLLISLRRTGIFLIGIPYCLRGEFKSTYLVANHGMLHQKHLNNITGCTCQQRQLE